jgi:LysM repeat protein
MEVFVMKKTVHWRRRAFVALGLSLILIAVPFLCSYSPATADPGTETYVFVLKWGAVSPAGQFKYPYGLAVDEGGNVYVADGGNHRIQKFNPDGNFVIKWGSEGSGDGQFRDPVGVSVDNQGNVYVADRENDRIQKFDSNGNFLAKWGGGGSGDGEFHEPRGVAVDEGGNVYVADTFNHRIQKFMRVEERGVIVVTSTTDSGPGSLRQALERATPGTTITFDPAIFPPNAPVTISLTSELPHITQGTLTIDGSNAGVILDGSNVGEHGEGLLVASDNNVIRGLQIYYFPKEGIEIQAGADHNTIGGDRTSGSGPTGEGNVISGNGVDGIAINSNHNLVMGNFIGTDPSGQSDLGNNIEGVRIREGAYNVIGGESEGQRNIISGNSNNGVWIHRGGHHNTVSGNFIGTNLNGTQAILNDGHGVAIAEGSYHNLVGGDTANERNLISGNGHSGVSIWDSGTMSNTVQGNYIGTDVSSTLALSNGSKGVSINVGASSNNIGPGNVVAYNGGHGIGVYKPDSLRNTITQNSIHDNGEMGIDLGDGGNAELPAPVISYVANQVVRGTAPPNSTVEIFSDDADEGKVFEGSTTADANGGFDFIKQGAKLAGPNITATATDDEGNSSEFSDPEPLLKPEVTGSDWLDAIPLPTEISTEPEVVGTNLGLALFFALAFGLTSALFNATLEENEKLIQARLAPLLAPLRRAAERLPRPAEGPRMRIAKPILLLLLSALLYAFLDPEFGISASGAIILLSLFVALAVLVYSYEGTQALLGARFYRLGARFQLFPIALAFGVACVLLTRWMNFHPGYLYGFVAGFAFLGMEAETPRRWALLVLAGAGALLATSLAAWGLAVPVGRLAEGGLPGASVLYGVLVAIFVAGLEGLLFTLVPLTFMDGSRVMAWSRAVWGVVFGLAAWLFFHVLINPGSAYLEALTSKKVLLMLGTLAVYSLFTVGTWLFFRWYAGRRAPPPALVEVEEPVLPPAGEAAIEPAVPPPAAPPRPEPVALVRPEAPEERVYPWHPMTWRWKLIYALIAIGWFVLWPIASLRMLLPMGPIPVPVSVPARATFAVGAVVFWLAVSARLLFEILRPEKVREVVVSPGRGVIFRRQSGEEEPVISKVTRLRKLPGAPIAWEIKGLSPEGKKLRARVFRRGAQGGLLARHFDEFLVDVRRLVAPDVEIEPPPLVIRISFWVMTSFAGLCILSSLLFAWAKILPAVVIFLLSAITFAMLSLLFLWRRKRAVATWSVVIGLAIVAGGLMARPELRAELPKLTLPQVELPFGVAKAPPTETPVPTPITFRDDVFSFEYPSNWKRMSESEVNAARAMLSLGGAAGDFEYVGGVYTGDLITGRDLGLVAVTVIKVSGLPGTLTDAQFSQLKATYERQIGSDLLSIEKTQVGSMSGVELEVLQSGMRNLLLLIFSGEQGRAYMFFCAASEGKFDDHLAVFESARSTLRISAPAPIAPTPPTPTATAPATPSPTVPTATPSPSPTVPVATPSPTVLATPPYEVITYTVQAGDTLSEIAAEFGVTVDAIAEANDIEDPSLIRIGQVLVIPSPELTE